MSNRKTLLLVKLFILGFCLTSQITSCKEKEKPRNDNNQTVNKSDILELEKTIMLPGVKGRIDHMAIDVKNQLLFIAALGNNSVEAVDLLKGERINSIKDIEEPQGVVFIPKNNTICVSSGGSGNCMFYDVAAFNLLNTIKLGTDADNMRFDSSSNFVFTGYGEGGIALIDGLKQSLIATISFSGHPEALQPVTSTGRIFVNVPAKKSIVVLDYLNKKVITNWKIENAASNFPMAIDENNQRLFAGCRTPPAMIVYNTESGKEITRFDIREDVDDIFYDESNKNIYISCGEGYLQVFKQENKDSYKLIEEVGTSKGARTSLFVPDLMKIYLAVPQTGSSDASILAYKIMH